MKKEKKQIPVREQPTGAVKRVGLSALVPSCLIRHPAPPGTPETPLRLLNAELT
jgi:hypothetical protein